MKNGWSRTKTYYFIGLWQRSAKKPVFFPINYSIFNFQQIFMILTFENSVFHDGFVGTHMAYRHILKKIYFCLHKWFTIYKNVMLNEFISEKTIYIFVLLFYFSKDLNIFFKKVPNCATLRLNLNFCIFFSIFATYTKWFLFQFFCLIKLMINIKKKYF